MIINNLIILVKKGRIFDDFISEINSSEILPFSTKIIKCNYFKIGRISDELISDINSSEILPILTKIIKFNYRAEGDLRSQGGSSG